MTPVSITNATKVYEGGVEALRGVSLDCAAGRVTALLGRSGCGKTTLLNLCGAMDFPTTGEVCLAGRRTTTLSDAELTALRRHKIGFVFQFFQLLPRADRAGKYRIAPAPLGKQKHRIHRARTPPLGRS